MTLIKDIYAGTSGRVRVGGKLSSAFFTTSDVRQGCVLAPVLFCRAIDFIMEHVSHQVSITVGDKLFTDLDYTDDMVLLVEQATQFAEMLEAVKKESAKLGLHVSWAKTKVQNLRWGPDADDVLVDGHSIEGVSALTYLGSKFASD